MRKVEITDCPISVIARKLTSGFEMQLCFRVLIFQVCLAVGCCAFAPDPGQQQKQESPPSNGATNEAMGKKHITHGDEAMTSMAISACGRLFASATTDKAVHVWLLETRTEILTVPNRPSITRALCFAPDGKTLGIGDEDGTISLLDIATGKSTRTFRGHERGVLDLTFSPNGEVLISASEDDTISIWEVRTFRRRFSLTGHEDDVRGVDVSPNGKILASSSEDGTVWLWETDTGKRLGRLRGHDNWVYAAAFSFDGRMLASCSEDKVIRIWNVKTRKTMLTLRGHEDAVYSVAFSPDCRYLASASWDKSIRLWEIATGQHMLTLPGHKSGSIDLLSFSHCGRRLVSASSDGTVLFWSLEPQGWDPPLKAGISPEKIRSLWTRLDAPSGGHAYETIWTLGAIGEEALESIGDVLVEGSGERVQLLISQLDDEDISVRDRAVDQLRKLNAEAALREGLESIRSPEARARAKALLSSFESPIPMSPRQLHRIRVIQVLERIGTDNAREFLKGLDTRDAHEALKRLGGRPKRE